MTREEVDLAPAPGFVATELRAEFPGLQLGWVTVKGGVRSSPQAVAERLGRLASRYRGTSVVAMRTQPIPHSYRTFFRQIGLDPDVDRIPSERVAVERLLHGGFRPQDLVLDALLIAVIETGVPVWALDADRVDAGGLGIRIAGASERLGTSELGSYLPEGSLVVADAEVVHALLFGLVAPGHEVTAATERIALFSVGVDGVPAIHVEEALWVCAETLTGTG